MEVYGQESPPVITEADISASEVPILMISSKYDRITNVGENMNRAARLTNLIEHVIIENGDHLSFLCGKDMSYLLNVIDTLAETENGIKDEQFRQELTAQIKENVEK